MTRSNPKRRPSIRKEHIIAAVLGSGVEVILGSLVSKMFSTQLFAIRNWVIASLIVLPWLIVYLTKYNKSRDTSNDTVMELFGINSLSPRQLRNSVWTPRSCINRTRHTLDFIGVLASKWVNDPPTRNKFNTLLDRLDEQGGQVRFILINPFGQSIRTLERIRGNAVSLDALPHLLRLQNEHPSFEVRSYETLPIFRLVAIDKQEMAIQAYHMRNEQYSRSSYGWREPQLVLEGKAEYPLSEGFAAYFNALWAVSEPLRERTAQ